MTPETHGSVSVPSSGDYQFLRIAPHPCQLIIKFPSPHPGIINFFQLTINLTKEELVSVPSSGDYQFLLFLPRITNQSRFCFRPLIRGLSISSYLGQLCNLSLSVSVPSSGDYQFLLLYFLFSQLNCEVSVPSSGDYQFLLDLSSML